LKQNWNIQKVLLAFKFLEEEHDGGSLSQTLIEVLEDYGIADCLLAVTCNNLFLILFLPMDFLDFPIVFLL
jgi:hypothetical protein